MTDPTIDTPTEQDNTDEGPERSNIISIAYYREKFREQATGIEVFRVKRSNKRRKQMEARAAADRANNNRRVISELGLRKPKPPSPPAK